MQVLLKFEALSCSNFLIVRLTGLSNCFAILYKPAVVTCSQCSLLGAKSAN